MSSTRETLLQFPCTFPLKVIGRNVEDFVSLVSAIMQKHAPTLRHEDFRCRLSKGNKYLAITVTFTAYSQKQLDTIYQELNSHELVLVTL